MNQAYEKLLGYTFTEVSGSNFIELQTRGESSQASPGASHPHTSATTGEIQLSNHSPAAAGGGNPLSRPSDPTTITTTPTTTNAPQPPSLQTQMSTTNNPSLSFHDHVVEELSHGKLWEGSYMYSRKVGEPIFLNSRVFPFNYHSPPGRAPSDLSLNK